jgi:hypothetical protein
MTFGYNANIFNDTASGNISTFATSLLSALRDDRELNNAVRHLSAILIGITSDK